MNKYRKTNINSCAPNSKQTYETYQTCYSLESLTKIAEAYNIYIAKDYINTNLPHKKLWNAIDRKLTKKTNCKTEWCWRDLYFIERLYDEDIDNFTFKPYAPDGGKYALLGTHKLTHILSQYDKLYPNFRYVGTYSLDFARVGDNKIRNFNLNDIVKNNITKFAFIFNLKPIKIKVGHWVALFVSTGNDKIQLDYFDSYGDPPPKEIKRFMNKIIRQARSLNKKTYTNINYVRHQLKDTECGMYVTYFIVKRAQGVPFKTLIANIITDEIMHTYRDHFFL